MSIIEIAKLAGVSHTTVSRVINNEGSVSPETAKKVRAVMKQVGYVPKPPSMRRGPRRVRDVGFKTGNIAFLASSESLKVLVDSPLMNGVVHGIEDALASYGMSMVQGAVGAQRPLPPIVAKGGVDGVILWPSLEGVSSDAIESLRHYKRVYVMCDAGDSLPGDCIRTHNGSVGRMAAGYLMARGHDTVAYLTPSSLTSRLHRCDRWAGFSTLAADNDVAAYQCVIEQSHLDLMNFDQDRDLLMQRALQDLFSQEKPPTGLFVTCDALTAKIYPILQDMGMRIGSDIDIISCNNEVSLLAGLDPRPVSIEIQAHVIGQRAVEQLRWRILHPDDDTQITIEIQPKPI